MGIENERTLIVKQDGNGLYDSIQSAVNEAVCGDTILVYGGIYREEVIFPRGGDSEHKRITLKAAEGEEVTISGANQILEDWGYDSEQHIYHLTLEKDYFSYNSEGEYFNPFAVYWKSKGYDWENFFSCGCVYINGIMMDQKWSIQDVSAAPHTWFATVDNVTGETTIYANFGNENPNDKSNCIEINVRRQCITAKWNQGYITISGLKVIRGCGSKTIDFWMTIAEPTFGALCTNGGYHWIIENCEVTQCRGAAIDYGSGSAKQELKYGGEPEIYGHHIIRYNHVHHNCTNGLMAYRGAYSEIHHNALVNNNTLNTGLLSEAYIKDVSGGFGIYIHDNYFYSDQDWRAFPVWMDSECDMGRFSKNIIYCLGAGKGFSAINYENNNGWNLIDNNILVGVGIELCASSCTYFVNNLWLDMEDDKRTWPPKMNMKSAGAEGYDGFTRAMRIVKPGELKTIGCDKTSRWQSFNNYNKMLNNIFFDRSLINFYNKELPINVKKVDNTAEEWSGAYGSCIEPEQNKNSIYGEMVLNTETDEKSGELIADPDYSGGTWKGLLPTATREQKEANRKYRGISAWVPADKETEILYENQIKQGDACSPYGNECDYNAYYAGASYIDNTKYGAAHGYIADTHSVVSENGAYRISATPSSFHLTLTIDDAITKMEPQLISGQFLGAPPCYVQAVKKYMHDYNECDYLPADVDCDFFCQTRRENNIAGPFSNLQSGTNEFKCWPKK